ncbi:MAG: hypothetical protein OXF62_09010 [Caldilineaceae bacterium]|nr:hypothetical protein [Caldilineaceae bacterium]MDE0179820.1 hypothetical protein [Caldilineaceae bacterium]
MSGKRQERGFGFHIAPAYHSSDCLGALWGAEGEGWRGLLGYITLVIFLTAAGPVYAYAHGIWMARSFTSASDIEVNVVSQELVLVERETEPDEPYRFRGVTTVYQLPVAVEEAGARLRRAVGGQRGMASFENGLFLGLL